MNIYTCRVLLEQAYVKNHNKILKFELGNQNTVLYYEVFLIFFEKIFNYIYPCLLNSEKPAKNIVFYVDLLKPPHLFDL